MLNFRRLVSVSRDVFQFYKVVKHSGNISKFSRIISNSGCLLSGCCFSRQSNEEALLPDVKDVHEVSKVKKNDNSLSHVNLEQSASTIMKRNYETLTDLEPEHIDADKNVTLLSNKCNKRQKIEDNEITQEESTKQAVITLDDSVVAVTELFEVKTEAEPQPKADQPKKQRPNYFVAVEVSDDQIHQSLKDVQQHILEKDDQLKRSMIQLQTLHITLMVMHIGDTETHAKAMEALKNVHQEHDEDFSKNPLKLEFRGLGHFQNRVLYAKLVNDSYSRLHMLANSVKKHFASASVFTTETREDFTPHLTVAKIREEKRKFKKQKKSVKKIDPALYKDYSDYYFGSQYVKSIQLLSMTDPKNEAGYYSGNEIFFSAFQPHVRRDYLNKILETEKKKQNVKKMINTLMKEKLQ